MPYDSEDNGPAAQRLRLDHVAIAVSNLAESLRFYQEQLGLAGFSAQVVEEQGVRVVKLDLGNTHIELLEPLAPDTPVGRFLSKRGPGIHHICIGVHDIDSELARLEGAGARLIDEQPRIGADGARIAFVHPGCTGGVLIELSERAQEHGQ